MDELRRSKLAFYNITVLKRHNQRRIHAVDEANLSLVGSSAIIKEHNGRFTDCAHWTALDAGQSEFIGGIAEPDER